jgi:hypothetical protein
LDTHGEEIVDKAVNVINNKLNIVIKRMEHVYVRLDGQGKIVMKILKNVVMQKIVQPM